MKNIRKNIVILILLFFSFSFSYGMDLSFKFSGGLSYLNLDNINRYLQDWSSMWEKEAQSRKKWNFEGEVKKFHGGLEFEGEIMITLSSRFAVSLDSGYIYGEIIDKKTEITVDRPVGTDIFVRPNKVSAYPLSLSGYFFLPLNRKISPYLKGSIGVYFAKYIDWRGKRRLPKTKFDFSSQIAEAEGLVIEGGLGFTVKVDSHLHLFMEGTARRAKISGFQGEIKKGEKGTLFFFEQYNPEIDFWQAKIEILTEKPEGANFRSVQEAAVDFSGFSAKIGLIIKF